MRLIDADEVLELFGMNEDCDKCTEDKRSCHNDILYKKSNFCDLINYIPTVEPERKKGKWIDMGDFEECSVCGCTHLKEFQSYYEKTLWVKSKFCPGCGAELRSEENDNA